jgi:hypothetical protein
MLEFKQLTLDHIALLRPFFECSSSRICDCTVGGTFMWRDFFHTQFAIQDSTLWLKVQYVDGATAFTVPLGGGGNAFEPLESYCRETETNLRYCMVSAKDVAVLQARYGQVDVCSAREWCDYLYLSSDICNLPGRRYSGQRNHINKFIRTYSDWSFSPLTVENIPEVRMFLEQYMTEHQKDSVTYDEGNEKTIEILDHYAEYGLIGGVLCVGRRVVGCAVGEIIGDTLFVHAEKSDRAYDGSYQMLVNRFANTFVDDTVHYINREEDDGDQGLRTSKLSYHPVELIEKYTVCTDMPCQKTGSE